MALRAVDDFAAQTHGPRELVVAIAGGDPAAREALDRRAAAHAAAGRPVTLRYADARGETCGGLRQAALLAADGDYCLAWDDDDRNHPRRLEAQAACLDGAGGPAALDGRLVVDLRAGTVTWALAAVGAPGGAGAAMPATLLFRRDGRLAYPAGGPETEEVLFTAAARRGPVAVVEGRPYLSCKVIHGGNARDPEQLRRWAARHAAAAPLLARNLGRIRREFGRLDWGGRAFRFAGGG